MKKNHLPAYRSISIINGRTWKFTEMKVGTNILPTLIFCATCVKYSRRFKDQDHLFFIVGKDASIEFNKPYLQQIIKRGHELGNHSFNHESWLQKYSHDEIQKEINDSHQILFWYCWWTIGWLPYLVLAGAPTCWKFWKRIYLWCLYFAHLDWSPGWKYYFMTSGLSKEERKDRSELLASFRWILFK